METCSTGEYDNAQMTINLKPISWDFGRSDFGPTAQISDAAWSAAAHDYQYNIPHDVTGATIHLVKVCMVHWKRICLGVSVNVMTRAVQRMNYKVMPVYMLMALLKCYDIKWFLEREIRWICAQTGEIVVCARFDNGYLELEVQPKDESMGNTGAVGYYSALRISITDEP